MRGCITAVIASLAFSLLAPGAWGQTEVDQVSFGYNNSWDGLVWIRRGSDGELYFTDTVAGTSISLEGLTTSPDSGITTTAADSRYVNVTGDETMTGDLTLTGTTPPQVYINSSSNAWFRAKSGATANAELNLLNGSSGWSWISNGTDGKLYLYNEDNTVNFVDIDNSTGDIQFNTIGGGTAIWILDSGTGATSQTGGLSIDNGTAILFAINSTGYVSTYPGSGAASANDVLTWDGAKLILQTPTGTSQWIDLGDDRIGPTTNTAEVVFGDTAATITSAGVFAGDSAVLSDRPYGSFTVPTNNRFYIYEFGPSSNMPLLQVGTSADVDRFKVDSEGDSTADGDYTGAGFVLTAGDKFYSVNLGGVVGNSGYLLSGASRGLALRASGKPILFNLQTAGTEYVLTGYGANGARTLAAALNQSDVVLRRDVNGVSSYSEAGSVLTIERNATNLTAENGDFIRMLDDSVMMAKITGTGHFVGNLWHGQDSSGFEALTTGSVYLQTTGDTTSATLRIYLADPGGAGPRWGVINFDSTEWP